MMRKTENKSGLDVFIVHTDSEWQVAQKIAALLGDYGYNVARSGDRAENCGAPARLPSNATAVLVIWPVTRAIYEMPEFEARIAARDGRLVQIYAGAERPYGTFAGPPPVDFVGWDLTATGPRWAALMRRLRRLCGPPPKRPVDVVATTSSMVLYSTLVIAMGSIAAVAWQVGRNDAQQAAAPPPPTGALTQEAAARAPIIAPRVAPAEIEVTVDRAFLGGPETYDTDLGVEVAPAPPPPPAPPPEPVKRAPQNPPSAFD